MSEQGLLPALLLTLPSHIREIQILMSMASQLLTTTARGLQKSPTHWLLLPSSSVLRGVPHAPPKHGGQRGRRCEFQDYIQHIFWPSHLHKQMRCMLTPRLVKGQLPSACSPAAHPPAPHFLHPGLKGTEAVPDTAPASSFVLRWLLR